MRKLMCSNSEDAVTNRAPNTTFCIRDTTSNHIFLCLAVNVFSEVFERYRLHDRLWSQYGETKPVSVQF